MHVNDGVHDGEIFAGSPNWKRYIVGDLDGKGHAVSWKMHTRKSNVAGWEILEHPV